MTINKIERISGQWYIEWIDRNGYIQNKWFDWNELPAAKEYVGSLMIAMWGLSYQQLV